MSRREELTKRFVNIPIPDVGDADYLTKYWHEAGTIGQGMSGPTPLPWTEIKAWREENDVSLQPFEVNLIRRMSQEYCSELSNTDPNRLAPLPIDEDDFDREAQGNAMKAAMQARKQRKLLEDESRYIAE